MTEPVEMPYGASRWGHDLWVVVRRFDSAVVSGEQMSHADAVVLAERLNVAVVREARLSKEKGL